MSYLIYYTIQYNRSKNLQGAGYNEIGYRRRTNANKNENYAMK